VRGLQVLRRGFQPPPIRRDRNPTYKSNPFNLFPKSVDSSPPAYADWVNAGLKPLLRT